MAMWRLFALAILAQHCSGAGATAPPCDLSRPASEVCADFCEYRCGFYNRSLGEDGNPRNVTLYRITPANVTGIRNKDTGDAPGDISFYLSKKNLTQQCARDPTSFGCFLDGDNIYGAFKVELSTQYGPYFECNPVNVGEDPYRPDWVDTRVFMCGQGCLSPTPKGCGKNPWAPPRNGTGDFGGYQCFCDGTARHNKTVGREIMPFGRYELHGPQWWPLQCSLDYAQLRESQCVTGKSYRQVRGWNFESTVALACDACTQDPTCEGWATSDNHTAELFTGKVTSSSDSCLGGVKYRSRYHHSGSQWGPAGNLGGYWYSTPVSAECPTGAPLGTNGCTWRTLSAIYKNASCVDGLADAEVELHGEACFSTCKQPLNRTSDCYVDCYKNTLLGDAGYNITAIGKQKVVDAWLKGFQEDDVSKGGCAPVTPRHCEGPQCGPPYTAAPIHNGDATLVI